MFRQLIGTEITVELKNDLCIKGKLQSVDQFLNMKLVDTEAVDAEKYPHMVVSLSFPLLSLYYYSLLASVLCKQLFY